ncbi:MAG: hypothetical protein KIT09_11885 [Bryobacteraceae bacterium]|nr:hypothetical protein [Bryobacteraceae bacterium]
MQNAINRISGVMDNAELIVWSIIPFLGVLVYLLQQKVGGSVIVCAALLSIAAVDLGHFIRLALYYVPWLFFPWLDLAHNRVAIFFSHEVLFAGIKVWINNPLTGAT